MSSDFRRQRPRRSATKSAADQVHEVDDDDNDRGAGHEVDSDSDVYQISDHEDSDTESFCEEEAGPKTPAARRRIASTKSTTTPIRTPRAKATSSPTKASAVKRKLKSNTTPASARPRKAASSNDVTCDDMTAQSPINNSNPNIIEPYPSQLTNRSYHGPLRLRRRIGFVLERFYGPIPADIKTAAGFINHWYSYDELPIINQRPEPAWLPADFQDQQLQLLHNWKSSGAYITQTETLDCGSGALSENTSLLKELIVISERNETRMQRLQVQLVPRLSPEHGDGGEASFQRPGWLLNLSGTVLNMTWAPKEVNDRQTLVVCVVPFGEGRPHGTQTASDGLVYALTFTGLANEDLQSPPVAREMVFPWGFSRRVMWCPQKQDAGLGLLGVLSTEGQVHVVDIDQTQGYSGTCVKIASLFLNNEEEIKVTCFAWVGFNRIVTGHVDGSVCLWSIAPCLLLARHATHHSYVVDITTGYPSRPYLVVSVPVAGLPTLVDFASPGYESTSWALPSIAMQSTALNWHDDLQGFFLNHPSSSPLDAVVSFMHCRYFPHGPAVISSSSAVTAFSAGYGHPFILVGLRDGSLWCANSIKKIFAARSEKPSKRKIMQHEFRPASCFPRISQADSHLNDTVRGASRLVACDSTELNERKDKDDTTKNGAVEGQVPEKGPAFRIIDPARAVNHEKETRIAAIEWNPVRETSGWTIVAMASGLLQLMNLGVAIGQEGE